MRIKEIRGSGLNVSPKKERALKQCVNSITREFSRAFKEKQYRITTNWTNEFTANLEIHIDSPALQADEKSYDALVREVDGMIEKNESVSKFSFLGGSTRSKFHYAVWELIFPFNL